MLELYVWALARLVYLPRSSDEFASDSPPYDGMFRDVEDCENLRKAEKLQARLRVSPSSPGRANGWQPSKVLAGRLRPWDDASAAAGATVPLFGGASAYRITDSRRSLCFCPGLCCAHTRQRQHMYPGSPPLPLELSTHLLSYVPSTCPRSTPPSGWRSSASS